MEGKEAWDLFAGAVVNGGSIEWLELGGPDITKTFRFRIRTASRSADGTRLNVVPVPGSGEFQFPNKNWRKSEDLPTLAFSQTTLLGADEGQSGQIDFETRDKKGAYYPPGKKPSSRTSPGFGPSNR